MLSDIASKREDLWRRFQDKERRDNWAASHLGTSLSAQIFSLREARGWTQRELADKTGMAQSRISVLEDPDYERFSVATLKRIASAFDVVFVGRFVSFSEMLEWSTDLTPDKLAPPEFARDVPSWQPQTGRANQAPQASAAQQETATPPKRETVADKGATGIFAYVAARPADGHFGGYGGAPRNLSLPASTVIHQR